MDYVHIWYDDRYWSKFYSVSTIPTPLHDLAVKGLNFFMFKLCVKAFRFTLFPNHQLDIGPKSNAVPSLLPDGTSRSRSEFLCLSFVLSISDINSEPFDGFCSYTVTMMIDIGSKFYTVPFPHPLTHHMTSRSRSQT